MNTSVGGASRLGAEAKVLDNGLTVLVREVRTAPSCRCGVGIESGRRTNDLASPECRTGAST